MIRITRLTDYAIVLMSHLATEPERVYAAPDLAVEARLPSPMVSKILKQLARAGLLASHRGIRGGYTLARPAVEITIAEVITALEGPIAMTECSEALPGICGSEPFCPVSRNWRRISSAVRDALAGITLAEMSAPVTSRQGKLVALGGSRP